MMKKITYQFYLAECKHLVMFACGLWLLNSCVAIAPVNTCFESTRILSKGQMECMGSYTAYFINSSDESENVNNNLGLRIGYGFSDKFDLKLRYEHLIPALDDDDININYFALSPRFSLKKDRITAALDLGKYFSSAENEETESTTVISPRFAFGNSTGKKFDFTLTTKLDIFPEEKEDNTFLGINFGCGLSSDLDKWAFVPKSE